jgi:hypothetical protein
MAHVLWRAADRLRDEARQLREDAERLEREALATDDLARRFSDGELRA